MDHYLLLGLIIAFASFTQGFSGFGAVLVALPCLALFLPIKTVVPLANLMSGGINFILMVQLRRYFQWSKTLPLLLAALPGITLGVYFLKTVEPWKLELFLAAVLIGFPRYFTWINPSVRTPGLLRSGHGPGSDDGFGVSPLPGFGSVLRCLFLHQNRVSLLPPGKGAHGLRLGPFSGGQGGLGVAQVAYSVFQKFFPFRHFQIPPVPPFSKGGI